MDDETPFLEINNCTILVINPFFGDVVLVLTNLRSSDYIEITKKTINIENLPINNFGDETTLLEINTF